MRKTNFDKPIYEAMERQEYALAKRLRDERRMVRALVNAILATGCSISIHDSEKITLHKSRNRVAIYDAMFTADEDYVYAFDKDGVKRGRFDLIYGNSGWDLVSDSSANPYCDEIWDKVIMPLSNKIQAGL